MLFGDVETPVAEEMEDEDFDSVTSCSCGLENADELLNYFLPYLEDWNNQRYTTHEFAKKYANKGISLWTANDVKKSENGIQAIQIFFRR